MQRSKTRTARFCCDYALPAPNANSLDAADDALNHCLAVQESVLASTHGKERFVSIVQTQNGAWIASEVKVLARPRQELAKITRFARAQPANSFHRHLSRLPCALRSSGSCMSE